MVPDGLSPAGAAAGRSGSGPGGKHSTTAGRWRPLRWRYRKLCQGSRVEPAKRVEGFFTNVINPTPTFFLALVARIT